MNIGADPEMDTPPDRYYLLRNQLPDNVISELESNNEFCENLKRYASGEALVNVVDPANGY